MSISIATLGKFSGIPTIESTIRYSGGGGGSSGATLVKEQHKFPIVRVQKINKESINIDIKAELIEE